MNRFEQARLIGRFIRFNDEIQYLFKEFNTKISPFGQAGSDKDFAKVCLKLVEFKVAWDRWFEKKWAKPYLSNVGDEKTE